MHAQDCLPATDTESRLDTCVGDPCQLLACNLEEGVWAVGRCLRSSIDDDMRVLGVIRRCIPVTDPV